MTTSSLLAQFRFCSVLILGMAVVCLVGCDSPGEMIRDIRKNLDAFKASPSEAALEKVEKSFVKIDAAIKDLEAKEDIAQADLFRRQAMTLRYEYRTMQVAYLTWKQEQAAKQPSTGSGK